MQKITECHIEVKNERRRRFDELTVFNIEMYGAFKNISRELYARYNMVYDRFRRDSKNDRRFYYFDGVNKAGMPVRVRVWFKPDIDKS